LLDNHKAPVLNASNPNNIGGNNYYMEQTRKMYGDSKKPNQQINSKQINDKKANLITNKED
jgi:hypothetical protein